MRRLGRVRPWWRRFKRNGYRVDSCDHCGHRFRWSRDGRHSFGNRDNKVLHAPCIAYLTWRAKAEERLDVLAVACEVGGLSDRDVKGVIEMRATSDGERIATSNAAFRVFYDLEKRGDS